MHAIRRVLSPRLPAFALAQEVVEVDVRDFDPRGQLRRPDLLLAGQVLAERWRRWRHIARAGLLAHRQIPLGAADGAVSGIFYGTVSGASYGPVSGASHPTFTKLGGPLPVGEFAEKKVGELP